MALNLLEYIFIGIIGFTFFIVIALLWHLRPTWIQCGKSDDPETSSNNNNNNANEIENNNAVQSASAPLRLNDIQIDSQASRISNSNINNPRTIYNVDHDMNIDPDPDSEYAYPHSLSSVGRGQGRGV